MSHSKQISQTWKKHNSNTGQIKRAIFHIGTPKTGTTYLQTFFSQHHDALREAGIDYPYAEDSFVIESGACVGNIVKMVFMEGFVRNNSQKNSLPSIAKILTNDVIHFIASVIERSDCDTVLFSAESMSVLDENIVMAIKQQLANRFDTSFIIFVRDPYDYFYSAWKQHIKSKFTTKSFEQHFKDIIEGHKKKQGMFTAFRTYWNNDIPLKIINYDSYKSQLAAVFFDVTGIKLNTGNSTCLQTSALHNRSLSTSEAHMLWLVNRRFNATQFPAYLRSRLLQRNSEVKGANVYYDRRIDTLILDHFADMITRINSEIHGDPLRTKAWEKNSDELHIEIDDLEILIEAFKFVEDEKHTNLPLLYKAKHILRCAWLKNVPYNFNPEAYLIMNKDVAMAGVDPYLHYSRNGHLEGRSFRYY